MTTIQKFDDLEIMFLEHYGVKGMKWGVRRSQKQLDREAGRLGSYTPNRKSSSGNSTSKKKAKLGSYTPKRKSNNSSKARLGSRSISELNDTELREITNRMDMERKYDQISGSSKAVSTGKKILQGVKTFNDVVNTGSNAYKNGKMIYDVAKKIKK